MNYLEIINKLIGPVNPTGSHEIDQVRLKNLKELIDLSYNIHELIEGLAPYAERKEASIKAIGNEACKYLNDMRS